MRFKWKVFGRWWHLFAQPKGKSQGTIMIQKFLLQNTPGNLAFQSDGRKDFRVAFLCCYLEGSHSLRPVYAILC